MRKEVSENPVELGTAVAAPHFEDRRVVMRAQRVVPLDSIRAQLRRRRMLFLGGAFAIAIVLGAAAGFVAVQIKRLAAPSQISQIEERDVTTAAAAETMPAQVDATAESSVVEEPAVEEEGPPVEQPARPVAPKRHEPERPRVVTTDRDDRTVQPSEAEQLEQIRDAVLYERWQERRARRVARRERRNGGDDRDLSRVDEIFEGRRRRTDRPY
jgi:type IV secretory pathway VirB10-like protein